jgi:uncharacterized membrane protein
VNSPALRPLWLWLVGLALVVGVMIPLSCRFPVPDLQYFYDYGSRLMQGQMPYRDYVVEYPPLALLPMTLPFLVTLNPGLTYQAFVWLFSTEMMLFGIACLVVVFRIVTTTNNLRQPPITPPTLTLSWLLLLTISIYPWRYDLFPTLLTLLALLAFLNRRPLLTGVWLGLGVVAKLYPLVLLPVFGLAYLARRGYRPLLHLVIGSLGAVGGMMLPVLIAAPQDALVFLTFHVQRGLQIESLAAGPIELVSALGLTKIDLVLNFGAWHIESPLAQIVIGWLPYALVLFSGTVLLLAWRRFRLEVAAHQQISSDALLTCITAVLLAFVIANKVFSPQYLLWIYPFGALLAQKTARWLLAIAALTLLVYPILYIGLMNMQPFPVVVLNIRNLLVLGLFVGLIRRLARWGKPKSEAG